MKVHKPKSVEEIKSMLSYLASCHDASVKSVCFVKDRQIHEDGSLVYPFVDMREIVNCNIKMELILNSYPTAKKDQIVSFEFITTKSFSFMQTDDIDYSDIYELRFEGEAGSTLRFVFYATENKVKVLSISCTEVICKEL